MLAARCLGFSRVRIVFKHILPNAIMPAVVFSMSDAVIDILLGSSLSFLGLGIQPPTAGQGARRVWSDSRGRVWVSEWNAGKVAVYDPAKKAWREWRLPG